MGLNFRARRT